MGHEGVAIELWRYPVKSFRGERLDEISVDARGVAGDRKFAVRDANGKFGSGKTTRRFRLLRGLFDFSAETDGEDVVVQLPDGRRLPVGDRELDAYLTARGLRERRLTGVDQGRRPVGICVIVTHSCCCERLRHDGNVNGPA